MIDLTYQLLFLGGLLTFASIICSIFSRRSGAPLLLLFLILGMLAGEDGIGGIVFNNTEITFLFGNMALALILLDGGLGTRKGSFSISLKPAFLLSTVGVVVTAAIVGSAAHWILGLPWLEAMLVGSIVASTDAAAVFGLIKNSGIKLKERTGATLEVESGINDPMAIFLTISLVGLLTHASQSVGWQLLLDFFRQLGLGLVMGFAVGKALRWTIERLRLINSLYPIMVLATGIAVFGLTNMLGGSGFLAIYIIGLIIGNAEFTWKEDVLKFHDGIAWLCQIGMFLMLGLLITPTHVLPILLPALAIAAVLTFLARPIAVVLALLPFHFPFKEKVFISWCGLRGAVPIILALYPSLAGLENTEMYFDLVFVVVVFSLVLQGWSIPLVAKKLGVMLPQDRVHARTSRVLTVQNKTRYVHSFLLDELSHLDGANKTQAPKSPISSLVAIVRGNRHYPAAEVEELYSADILMYLSSHAEDAELAERFLSARQLQQQDFVNFYGEFVVHGHVLLSQIADVYGLNIETEYQNMTVKQYFLAQFHEQVVVGDSHSFGHVRLIVRSIHPNRDMIFGLKLT